MLVLIFKSYENDMLNDYENQTNAFIIAFLSSNG